MGEQTPRLPILTADRPPASSSRVRATPRLLLGALGLTALEALGAIAVAAVIVVDSSGEGGIAEIQMAIDEAADGDTVLVRPGEYLIAEPLRFTGKRITVRSEAGPTDTTIRMIDEPADPRLAPVVVFDSGERRSTVLEGFTLTGGRGFGNQGGGAGGGVYCGEGSSPAIVNCAITGNSAETRGGGVYCLRSSPMLLRCTITGNSAEIGGGVFVSYESFPRIGSCIIWDNAGGSLQVVGESMRHVRFSCVEGETPHPGRGNINADPAFCGWGSSRVLLRDQRGLEEVLRSGFGAGLAAMSPCLGTGEDGADMGAALGRCGLPGERSRLIDLAPGTYEIAGLGLAHGVSLRGAVEDETVIEGTVVGLRTGASLAHVTVTAGTLGGVRVAHAEAPEIVSCTFSRNHGPGIYCGTGSSADIRGCTMTENRATLGAGLYVAGGATPTLADCEISRNLAERGGGIHVASIFPDDCDGVAHDVSGAAPAFVDCRIRQNWVRSGGGGAFFAEGSSAALTGCDVSGNAALQSGGGIFSFGFSTTLSRCTVAGNSAGLNGGGAFLRSESSTVSGCLIAGNFAKRAGAGLFVARSSAAIVNCTVPGNLARHSVAGIYSHQSPVSIRSSVVWDNFGDSIGSDQDSEVEVIYSCVAADDVWPGRGNINVDPRFHNPGLFDFDRAVAIEIDGEFHDFPDFVVEAPDHHLEPDSPCVDTGRLEGAPGTDLDEKVRPCGSGVDMGAFEWGDCLPVRFLRGDCNGDRRVGLSDAVCILSWLFAGRDRPGCLAALNTNGQKLVELADAIGVLNFLFAAGPPPPAPYPHCASSALASDRNLGCERPAEECR